jgi:3-(3-hydroxy-phenyl)propionate hydroxylase
LLDKTAGQGWRLVLDGRAVFQLTEHNRDAAEALGIRILSVAPISNKPVQRTAAPVAFAERDGVMERWFEANKCNAAVVRPDHYVFGVATNEKTLATLLANLGERLR